MLYVIQSNIESAVQTENTLMSALSTRAKRSVSNGTAAVDDADGLSGQASANCFTAHRLRQLKNRFVWWSGRHLDKIFTSVLPSDEVKDMQPIYKYGVGCILLVILVGVFAAFFVSSFLTEMSQVFLSPLYGDTASANCETILIQNTGQYLATLTGEWEGMLGFEYSQAAFSFYASNSEMSPADYETTMWQLYNELEMLAPLMAYQDLSINLLVWTSFTRIPPSQGIAQRFTPMGDAVSIFNREYFTVRFSSPHGICNATSYVSFDATSGRLHYEMSATDLVSDAVCNHAVSPDKLGYLPLSNNDMLNIVLDSRSLMTAVAVNLGILPFSSMAEIKTYRVAVPFNGRILNTSRYIDPKFPGMDPVACITDIDSQLCTMLVGDVLAVPYFLHKGINDNLPEKCDCHTIPAEDLQYMWHPCNVFQFLGGFVFWNTYSVVPALEFMNKYNFHGYNSNAAMFEASFASSYWGLTSVNSSWLTSPDQLSDAFEACDVPSGGKCSLLTVSAFDLVNSSTIDWTVSNYYYQVANGACRASLTPSRSDWQKLIDIPYAPLVQQYQKCKSSATSAVFTTFGVSVGNLSAATPIVVAVFLTLILTLQRCLGRKIPMRSYAKEDKDNMIQALSVSLLRERDHVQALKRNREMRSSISSLHKESPLDGDDDPRRRMLRLLLEQMERDEALVDASGGVEQVFTSPMQVTMEMAEIDGPKATSNILILNAPNSSVESLSTDTLDSKSPSTFAQRRATMRQLQSEVASLYLQKQTQSNASLGSNASFRNLVNSATNKSILVADWTLSDIAKDAPTLEALVSLMKHHCCLRLQCSMDQCLSLHGRSVGYQFRDGIFTLATVVDKVSLCDEQLDSDDELGV